MLFVRIACFAGGPMSLELATQGPCFVRPYRPDKGGVDFLGLRQVNLDMMSNCLPGINNVTSYIRPFSVVSWIYWKFHQLSVETGSGKATERDLRVWKEKVETLFTWSHDLREVLGIPGLSFAPPGSGAVPLDFSAWQRNAANTSLMAAVQYGPAAKTIDGLGFLFPVEKSFFQTVGEGIALAEALDRNISRLDRHALLKDLRPKRATAKQAEAMYEAWSILEPSKPERDSFRRAFFNQGAVGESNALGRRSTTIQLILDVLTRSRGQLDVAAVRSRLFLGHFTVKRSRFETPNLTAGWLRWFVLQLRQAQRLAMEGLLSWFEVRLAGHGDRDTDAIVLETLKTIKNSKIVFPFEKTPKIALARLQRELPNLQDALDRAESEAHLNPLRLMERIEEMVGTHSDELAPYCLHTLFYCAAVSILLQDRTTSKPELHRGLAERVSLAFWTATVLNLRDVEMKDFLRLLFENLILSQHFAVAARRFDGRTQRLRISIEEEGLEFLADNPFVPTVTPDRLGTALSLMADSGLIGLDPSEGKYFSD
jgi:hypothetical protein